jgi:hypothetical protein
MKYRQLVSKDRFTPTRDRGVNAKIVVCPVCKAQVGDPCLSLDLQLPTNRHVARRRMAVRALNQENK